MHVSVANFFRAFNVTFEGLITHMYLDVLNLATIGIGTLLENPVTNTLTADALAQPFTFKVDGRAALTTDIQNDFASIKLHPGLKATSYDTFTSLELDLVAIDALVANKLTANETALKGVSEFSDLDNWPADAQLALFSMAYAMGAGFASGGKFPSFRAACDVPPDFSGAADECRMKEAGNPGVVPRNRADEILFLYADRVLANGLPVEDLIYPNVLKSDGTVLDMGLPAGTGGYPVLKIGSTGPAVSALQNILGLTDTGTFDATTDAAVKTFQGANTKPDGTLLTADGVVGWESWRVLVRAA